MDRLRNRITAALTSPSAAKVKETLVVYGRMIKFSHTIFALPFALSAVVLASAEAPLTILKLFWILVAMVGARTAAMGVNRIVDADIDSRNPRTAMREIPKGEIGKKEAWLVVAGSSLVFIFAAAMLSPLCFKLSFPVLLLLGAYSFTKRFTWLCHIYLGFAISMAPLGAWIAVTGGFSWGILTLSLALLTYIAGFDILYACQDSDFDREKGLHSIPATMGIKKAMQISTGIHAATFGFMLLLWPVFSLGWPYGLAVALIGALLVVEHKLVNPKDLTHVNIAFFHMNSIISMVLFAGILAGHLTGGI
ncbi:UbiA-like polyprenyltransferase [Desulfoluna spongiiphila]|uniref:4-hydroxybenzoate polyprenyltransferase n=1 Tax=Desulfoluna spongiiphila TaxID=419481 RepID=A0A1G5I3I0_9BACT|nr:UbiA-like polyprenyltransferase [Desulfoluna spongiiphila]SCY70675.1 4-hydroxybenzoate polyprenyltransferase [Desulfoluna spongiiphila]VVS92706.1 4-hydroxybenzoate polyprenyltransferase-related [Desulfoluna spongiiphila]